MSQFEISVRPEIVLRGTNARGKQVVGGIKLHFPKANPLSADAAGYISAATQEFCRQHLGEHGAPESKLSFVIDVPAGAVHGGVTATRQRLREAEQACSQIASLWPAIQP